MIFKHIVIGADSAGYALKEQIKAKLAADGYDVTDCGTDSDASCHYPVYGAAVARAVQAADAETCGILVCGTGVGMNALLSRSLGEKMQTSSASARASSATASRATLWTPSSARPLRAADTRPAWT